MNRNLPCLKWPAKVVFFVNSVARAFTSADRFVLVAENFIKIMAGTVKNVITPMTNRCR